MSPAANPGSMPQRCQLRQSTRWALLALVAVVAALGLLPATSQRASAEPLGEYAARLAIKLSGLIPTIVTAQGTGLVTMTGRYTNTGPGTIDELSYRFQRGDRLRTVDEIEQERADPSQPMAVLTSFRELPDGVRPGATDTFSVTAPLNTSIAQLFGDTDPDSNQSLGITQPGVYPLMLNINGTVHTPQGDIRARVGELHLLLTVASLPGGSGDVGDSNNPDNPDSPSHPGNTGDSGKPPPGSPIGMLWPVTSAPHLGVGGIFTSDALARAIRPGGRLHTIVSTLTQGGISPNLITLAIDPMLLDELDRMTHGYRVVADPGTPQPRLAPAIPGRSTATTTSTSPTTTAPTTTATTKSTIDAPGTSPPGSAAESTGQPPSTSTSGPSRTHRTNESGPATAHAAVDTPASTTGFEELRSDPPSNTASTTTPGTNESGPATAPSTTTPPTTTPTDTTPTTTSAPAAPGVPETVPLKGTVMGSGTEAARQFLDTLRRLASTHQIVVLPYGDPDIVAMVRAGMSEKVVVAVERGRTIARRVLAPSDPYNAASPRLVMDIAVPPGGAITPTAWGLLRGLGYTSVVLGPNAVTQAGDAADGTISAGRVRLADDDAPATAVISGGEHAAKISQLLHEGTLTGGPRSVTVMAAKSMLQRWGPTILVADRGFTPQPEGVTGLTSLISSMVEAGFLRPSPIADMADVDDPIRSHGSSDPPLVRLDYSAAARKQELPASYLSGLTRLSDRIGLLERTLGKAKHGPDPAGILSPLTTALRPATSASLRGQVALFQPVLTTVRSTVDWLYRGVYIQHEGSSYTLASSSAPLLLTVHNALPYTATVGIHILGGQQVGLTTNEPDPVTIQGGPRSMPVTIESSVSRSGTFTVRAQLVGPEGQQWESVRLTIHSRAYGALTLVLMILAGGTLMLMVVWRLVQRWRGRGGRVPPHDDAPGIAGAP